MSGYPISWDDRWANFDAQTASPYTPEEIEDYLRACQAQYSPEEEQFATLSIEFVATISESTRRFWIWRVPDRNKREWFVIIGSGMGPFSKARQVDRWIYAETNDHNLGAEDFLAKEIAKHP